MGVAFFFLFCIFIFLLGSVYVGLAMHHHYKLDRAKKMEGAAASAGMISKPEAGTAGSSPPPVAVILKRDLARDHDAIFPSDKRP